MFEGVRVAYGDHAPQFVSACQQLGIAFDHFVGCWITSVILVFCSDIDLVPYAW